MESGLRGQNFNLDLGLGLIVLTSVSNSTSFNGLIVVTEVSDLSYEDYSVS